MEGISVGAQEGDVEVWDRMTRGAREYEYAIKKSGRWLTTEPFFIAILFLQYKTIRSLEGEAERLNKLRRDAAMERRLLDGVRYYVPHSPSNARVLTDKTLDFDAWLFLSQQ